MDAITDTNRDKDPELLTVPEVAAWLRVRPQIVRKLINDGSLEGTKVGREWRVPRPAVRQYLRRELLVG